MKEIIKTVMHYPIYYHECYDEMKQRGYSVDEEKLHSDVMMVMKLELDPTTELNVLSVGCGNGKVDEQFIDHFLTMHSQIKFMAVDPAVDELAKFKHLVNTNKGKWQNVVFEFHASTIEDYIESKGTKRFGLIIASHAAYHFKDVESTMVKLFNCLINGGILFSKTGDGHGLIASQIIGQYYTDPLCHFIGTADIEDIVKRRFPNIRYESKKREHKIDITDCFKDKSQSGCRMLDFITNVYKFRETCSPEIKKKILDYVSENSTKEGDKLFFSMGETDLIFFNN